MNQVCDPWALLYEPGKLLHISEGKDAALFARHPRSERWDVGLSAHKPMTNVVALEATDEVRLLLHTWMRRLCEALEMGLARIGG